MMVHIRHIALMLLSLLALAGCDRTIHEYPTTPTLKLTVCCYVDLSHPEHFVTVECDAKKGTTYVVRSQSIEPGGTRFTEPVCLRYVVDLYRECDGDYMFAERKVLFSAVDAACPQAVATFDVDASKYEVLVWCDYVQDDIRKAWYYNTDDLRKVVYSDQEVVDNNDKDVFTNMLSVDLSSYAYACKDQEITYDVSLSRPNGRFKCITTDVEEYLKGNSVSVDDITAVVTYVQYVSAGYDVEQQRPNYYVPTRTFITSTAHMDDNGMLELCNDYVFVNGKQTNVKINFAFYQGEVSYSDSGEIIGDKISNWSGILVPLKRNMETVIEGRLLTTSYGTGGVGIDPGFDGEINIPWGD